MRQRGFYQDKRATGRRSIWRSGGFFYIIIALGLMIFESINNSFTLKVRSVATDIAAPVLDLFDTPIRAVQDGITRLVGVGKMQLELSRLKNDIAVLREWETTARKLMIENEKLINQLKGVGGNVPIVATGRIIGIGGGTFEKSLIVNVGRRNFVQNNDTAVSERGLLGKVINVGFVSSRVLLITDLNSRVPVMNIRTGVSSIAQGNNGDELDLKFLPLKADIKIGDIFVTSGQGGIYPPDLPLGKVSSINDESISLKPTALLDRLDFVRILSNNSAQTGEDKSILSGDKMVVVEVGGAQVK